MSDIPTGTVPSNLSPELSEYLNRLMIDINIALSNTSQLIRYTRMPDKVVTGKIYYFENLILPDIAEEGYWALKTTGWVQLG